MQLTNLESKQNNKETEIAGWYSFCPHIYDAISK